MNPARRAALDHLKALLAKATYASCVAATKRRDWSRAAAVCYLTEAYKQQPKLVDRLARTLLMGREPF